MLGGINFANFLQNFWKTAKLCPCKSLLYLHLYKGLARKFILTQVSPLKIFQVLWVRRLYKSIAAIEILKKKVVKRSNFRRRENGDFR